MYHVHTYLQYEETGVEDAGVDEDSTKLATLEQFVTFAEEEVVGVEHDHSIILDKLPCVQFV